MAEEAARKRWEVENNVTVESDEIYRYDETEQDKLREAEPWKADPTYFKKVMHAREGCSKIPGKDPDYEVMGLLQGQIRGDTLVVMDSFAVAQGNEVRVNAGVADFEFMVQYTESVALVGKSEPAIGWYHSHPGYGCWLSGIDVNTQTENQSYQDPWLAIVVRLSFSIDPKQTMSSGRVEIGAFRCYPKDYKPPNAKESEWQYIPRDRIEEFGVHAEHYYKLDIQIFKSSLDSKLFNLLWNKYWVKTLATSPNVANLDYTAKQIEDLASKLEKAERETSYSRAAMMKKKHDESELEKLKKDSGAISVSQLTGVMNQVVKNALFNANLSTPSQ